MATDTYIWINRWEEFQTFQQRRGKPWAPPWIRIYPRILDDHTFTDLPEHTQLLLVKLWMVFSTTRQRIPNDTRWLSRRLGQRVTKPQLKLLNHAGYIQVCSGTVLEQRRNLFWNGSALELEVEEEKKQPTPNPNPELDQPNGHGNIADLDFGAVLKDLA